MEFTGVLSRHPIRLTGTVKVGRKTKLLLRTLEPGRIVVLNHDDIDELAAEGLIQAKVKAVINAGKTMSGRIMTGGPLLLLKQRIPVFEINELWFSFFRDGMQLLVDESGLWAEQTRIPYTAFTEEQYGILLTKAQSCYEHELSDFVDNSLMYAQLEKSVVLGAIPVSRIKTKMENRDALIVSRGSGYRSDLIALSGYIGKRRPVLIAVDGGADALLELGYKPHIIIGDMDSVSDDALRVGAELIVHGYVDGRTPGMERIDGLGLTAATIRFCGTSEDVAMLLAYERKAERIVAVGSHSHMVDFREKGRGGMGSTLLVRLKVGAKLIDARGASVLIERKDWSGGVRWVVCAAIVAITAAAVKLGAAAADMAPGLWVRAIDMFR